MSVLRKIVTCALATVTPAMCLGGTPRVLTVTAVVGAERVPLPGVKVEVSSKSGLIGERFTDASGQVVLSVGPEFYQVLARTPFARPVSLWVDCRDACAPITVEMVEARRVSIISLIAVGERFHNAYVEACGFFHISGENEYDAGLWLNEQEFHAGISENAIRLELGPDLRRELRGVNSRYICVLGVFAQGPYPINYGGAILEIDGWRDQLVSREGAAPGSGE